MSEQLLPHQGLPVDRVSLGRGRLQLEVVPLGSGVQPVSSCPYCKGLCFEVDED